MSDRDEKGRFAEGHAPTNNGKGGRPSKAREIAIIAIAQEKISLKRWEEIFYISMLDALGKKVVNGQEVDDKDSTAQGRNTARIFLRDTLVGKPADYIKSDDGDSAYSQLDAYSEAERAAALERIRNEIARIRNSGGDAGAIVGNDEAQTAAELA